MLNLAVPVVVAEMSWVTMGTVDILMVRALGPSAIGAVGVGSMLFMALAVFGIGVLLGLDTLIAQSFGAGQRDECHRWFVHGLVMSVILTIPLTFVAWVAIARLDLWGFDLTVLNLTEPYLRIVTWSVWPLLLYTAFLATGEPEILFMAILFTGFTACAGALPIALPIALPTVVLVDDH